VLFAVAELVVISVGHHPCLDVFAIQERVNKDVRKMRNLHIGYLWNMTEALNVLHPDDWTHQATQILDNYTEEVYKATKSEGWEFDLGAVKEKELQWSFAGSLLYSITVITTIGQCICPSVRLSVCPLAVGSLLLCRPCVCIDDNYFFRDSFFSNAEKLIFEWFSTTS